MGAAGTQCSRVLITLTEAPAKVVFARSVSLVKIKPSQRFHKENKMRILVALIAVFMVSGAVAQKKPNTPSYDCTNAGSCSDPTVSESSVSSKDRGRQGRFTLAKTPRPAKHRW